MEKFSGVPVWHVSVALHVPDPRLHGTPQALLPVEAWSPADRVRANEIMRHVLRGVGRDVESSDTLPRSLHRRRLFTTTEAAAIGGTQDRRTR